MQTYNGVRHMPQSLPGSVVTIGNFDGLHLGHRALVNAALKAGRRDQVTTVAMTFSPHPVKVLAPEKGLTQLFDKRDLEEQLTAMGLDVLIIEPFTRDFAQREPEEFVRSWLVQPLAPVRVVVGYDFSFGKGRSGGIEDLRRLGQEHGFEVEVIPPVELDGVVVSSGRIRQAVKAGNVEKAERMLGRAFYLRGEVRTGARRGRKIGFPTLNLEPEAETLPASGVYCTRVWVGEDSYPAVTNVGTNPTFREGASSAPIKVESHLLAHSGEYYGWEIKVEFLRWLRAESRFAGVEELKQQIAQDVAAARTYFGIPE